MNQTVDLEVFYPHPPKRVWQVLTDRRALAAWMMENDFEPRLGHRFQFYSRPLPGLKTTIQCEVVELEEPTRLVYTWQESSTAEPSLVVWTLNTAPGGTQLRLKHYQNSYATAVATVDQQFQAQRSTSSAGLDISLCYPTLQNKTHFNSSGTSTALELLQFQPFTWDYFLNQTLPQVLKQDEPACC